MRRLSTGINALAIGVNAYFWFSAIWHGETIWALFYGFLLGALFGVFILSRRSQAVYKYRIDLLDDLSAELEEDRYWINTQDISEVFNHITKVERSFAKFDEVSLDEMTFKFWKPLDSFYEDESFAGRNRPGVRRS